MGILAQETEEGSQAIEYEQEQGIGADTHEAADPPVFPRRWYRTFFQYHQAALQVTNTHM